MLTTLNAALPLFSSVTACAVLLVPTAWMPKDRLDGERFTTDAAPAKFTVCGLPEALSLMLRSPARGPPSVGANDTLTVQRAPAATEPPQLFVCVKSPPAAMPAIARAALPALVTEMVSAALVVPTS